MMKLKIIYIVFLVLLTFPAFIFAGDIHEATQKGDLEKVKTLLQKDPTLLNAGGENQKAPLHWAVVNKQNDMIDFLIAKGAGLNIKNNNGETPLDLAVERGLEEIEKLLESKGAGESPVIPPKVFQLGKQVYRMVFPYHMQSNIGVSAGEDGILLVDTGFSRRDVKVIREVLRKFGNGKGEVKYVINTHPHWDHVAGNEIGGEGALVFDYNKREQMVAKGIISLAKGPLKGRTGKAFEGFYTLRFNGEEIRLIPYPGIHSNADWLIHFTASGVVFVGDLLLSESFPAVGRNVAAYMEFLGKVIDIFPEKTTFVSGHGKDLAKAGLKDYYKMLRTTIAIVRKGLKAGKSAKEMQKEKVLKGYEDYGILLEFLNTDSWIGAVSRSYVDKK